MNKHINNRQEKQQVGFKLLHIILLCFVTLKMSLATVINNKLGLNVLCIIYIYITSSYPHLSLSLVTIEQSMNEELSVCYSVSFRYCSSNTNHMFF